MKKILVVDDDFQQRDLYQHIFIENGMSVTSAKDGQEAWDILSKENFDLVFTGIIMPRMDGFALVEKMRQNPVMTSMPVIVFSHRGRDEDRAKASQLGVSFMVKGYDSPKQIVEHIQTLMGGAVTSAPSNPHTAPVPPPVPPHLKEDDRQGPGMI